jgi:nicotinamide mononucleotide (NMN) deamidase PncC
VQPIAATAFAGAERGKTTEIASVGHVLTVYALRTDANARIYSAFRERRQQMRFRKKKHAFRLRVYSINEGLRVPNNFAAPL